MKIAGLVLLIIIAIPAAFVFAAFCRSAFLTWKRPARRLYEKRKADGSFCEYNRLPRKTIDFVLAMEDIKFFYHNGYDAAAMKRALRLNLQRRKIVMGGSTITQQLAKNLYYRFEPTLFRKISEFFTALHIEKNLSKTEILELYLNVIYYGNGIYGLADAARFYFDMEYHELDVSQTFCLLCMLSSPTAANPLTATEVFARIRDRKVGQVLWLGDEKKYAAQIKENSDSLFDAAVKKHGKPQLGKAVMINEKYNRKAFS